MTDAVADLLETRGLSISDFTPEDRDFLQSLANAGGTADTQTLGETAGLKRKQIHYRYDKLEERGMIDVDRAGDHNGTGTNSAELTEYGHRLVDAGLFAAITEPNTNIESLQQQIDSLKGRVEHLEESRRHRRNHRDDRLDELAERIDRLEENVAVDEFDALTPRSTEPGTQDPPAASRYEARARRPYCTNDRSGTRDTNRHSAPCTDQRTGYRTFRGVVGHGRRFARGTDRTPGVTDRSAAGRVTPAYYII